MGGGEWSRAPHNKPIICIELSEAMKTNSSVENVFTCQCVQKKLYSMETDVKTACYNVQGWVYVTRVSSNTHKQWKSNLARPS